MGAWGSELYANDCTSDVRDTYTKFLQDQLCNEDAYQKTIEQFHEYIGNQDEPFLWYALADTQWKTGRLMPEVKEKALKWIKQSGGLELWEESKNSGAGWKKTLEKLKNQLETPVPPEKKIMKPVEFVRNPWNVGDVYAYQFHTEIAKERGLLGKYILFQKVGNAEWCNGWIFSIVQVFDRIFDEIPILDAIKGVRILPLFYPPGIGGVPKTKNDYIPSFESCLKGLMLYYKKPHYPKKHLYFIGNQSIPNIEYHRTQYSELSWEKDGMDDWLSDYYLSWQNIDY